MTQKLAEIIRQADSLTYEEQMVLISHLSKRTAPSVVPRRWSDLRGRATAPLAGEDAQAWVSRTRAQDQRRRESA